MKTRILGFFLCLLVGGLLFFVGMDKNYAGEPTIAYQVYLNGEKIGLIQSKDELLDKIDSTQSEIREKYQVDKVYPPNGLDIEKVYTYNDVIDSIDNVYKKINNKEPFTIEGYTAKIIYTEDKIVNDTTIISAGEPVYLYMMDKSYISEALYKTASAFIGEKDLKNYEDNTQEEITDTGVIITSVYFEETITVKKDLISTNEYIFKNSDDLTKYLLYGTNEDQASYKVKDGEDLNKIATANNLNIEELMIANPQFASPNVLLSEGEEVNVGLISPIVNVVYRKTVVDDITVDYKQEKEKDNTKYTDYKEVIQQGENGVTRVTQDVKYVNGEISNLVITNREVIKPVVNEITKVGTKTYGGGYYFYENTAGNDNWSWPTISPFVITSRYAYRWGSLHAGIDISGTGYGSPVYAVNDGVVVESGYHYSMGNYILVDHQNNYYTQYMHLQKSLVKVGQRVSREEKIGLMGNSGYSTGTHLHLGVWVGYPYVGGKSLDPCKSIFQC